MAKVRVGMIGCGGNATGHLRRLKEIPEVEVVALADVSEQSFARMFERVPGADQIPRFDDYKKMLESVEMDAVEISTPHTCHFERITCASSGSSATYTAVTSFESAWA